MAEELDITNQKFGEWVALKRLTKEESPNKKYIYWLCKCSCGIEKPVRKSNLINGISKSCGHGKGRKGKDLTNQKFGKLTPISPTNERNHGSVIWNCICDCGKEIQVTAENLLSGNSKSCGCTRGQKLKIDITGKTFGKLTVLKEVPKIREGRVRYLCKCTCGNEIEVDGHDLKSGNTQSCGCLKSRGEDKIINILKKLNIPYKTQKTFETCRFPESNFLARFDFYLPNENFLIEYDGIQHFYYTNYGWNNKENFEKTQQRDKYKNQWCKENNIPLIRIPYTDFNKINEQYLLSKIKNLKEDKL